MPERNAAATGAGDPGQHPEVERWPIDKLDLDAENARLPEDLEDRGQSSLIQYFERAYDLEELAWSMAEHGYFPEEPLLTITNPRDSSRRIVVEGNRRLATLKLLIDPDTRALVGKPLWEELREFAADHDLHGIPTRNYPNRESFLDYLGFRHVSGLLQWTAAAKARFVHRLVVEYDYTFDKAAKVIGSRADAIRRQFVAWRALEQARERGVDVSDAIRHFGVYYRALQNPAIREYLRLTGWFDADERLLTPLDPIGLQRLSEFLGFVFGRSRVIQESRQLDDLGKALANPLAYAVLKDSHDLQSALLEIPANRETVYVALRQSYRQAARANAEAFQFAGDADLVVEARRLSDLVAQLLRSLEGAGQPRATENLR